MRPRCYSRRMSRATIPIHHAVNIVEVVKRQGIDPATVLRRANISPALLDSALSRLTQAQFSAVIRTVVRLTRDEFWGMGKQPVTIGTFAAACRLAASKRTLREAIRAGLHHYHLCTPDIVARLSVDGRVARIRVGCPIADPISNRLLQATFMFFLYGLMCWYVGKRVPLHGADFSYLRADSSNDAVRAYYTDVRFGRPCSELRFDTDQLKAGSIQDSHSLEILLRGSPGTLGVGFRDRSSMTDRVTRLLRQNIAQSVSLDDAARTLAVSEPTLRRHLAAEGHSFRDLKDVVRRDAAIELLHGTQKTLERVAESLGFSDVSTFHRAFKRWTGAAPGDYRRTGRE